MFPHSPIDDICRLLTQMLQSLLDNNAVVKVTARSIGDTSTALVVDIPEGPNMGRIIGKQGRTARALRVIILAAGRKHRMNFQLDINGQQIADGDVG